MRSINIIAAYYEETGITIYFHSAQYCSDCLKIGYNKTVRRLKSKKPLKTEHGQVQLRRVPILIYRGEGKTSPGAGASATNQGIN